MTEGEFKSHLDRVSENSTRIAVLGTRMCHMESTVTKISEDIGVVRDKVESKSVWSTILVEVLKLVGLCIVMALALSQPEVVKAVTSAQKVVP